jgi:hypothetical protein
MVQNTTERLNTAGAEIRWRPFFVALIRSGVVLARNVQAFGQNLYSGAKKLIAEASAELDQEHEAKASRARPGASDRRPTK